jgi:hypothetical protein
MTCRPGWLAWAPMACGSALAMEPWLNEPISQRGAVHPQVAGAQMHGVPTSTVKIASSRRSASVNPFRESSGIPYTRRTPDAFSVATITSATVVAHLLLPSAWSIDCRIRMP